MVSYPRLEQGAELSIERGKATGKTVLRGWKSGSYLLVDLPGGSWAATDRTPVICRLVGRDSYYGFTTASLGVLREFKLLVLRYPDDIIDMAFRKSARYDATLPVTIIRTINGNIEEDRGVINDISEGGCQLITSREFEIGDKLHLRVSFPTGSSVDNVACVLRRVDSINEQNVYGAEFDFIEDKDKDPITVFLDTLKIFYATGPVA